MVVQVMRTEEVVMLETVMLEIVGAVLSAPTMATEVLPVQLVAGLPPLASDACAVQAAEGTPLTPA